MNGTSNNMKKSNEGPNLWGKVPSPSQNKNKSNTTSNDIVFLKTPKATSGTDDLSNGHQYPTQRIIELATAAAIINKIVTKPVTLESRPIIEASNLDAVQVH